MNDYTTITGLKIYQHSYFERIQQFQLDEDTYPYWNMLCIEAGNLQYQVMNRKGIVQFGDILLCPPNIPLKRKAVTSLKFHFLQFSFKNIETYHLPIGKIKMKDKARLSSTYAHLRDLAFNETERSQRLKAHFIYDLLQLVNIENKRLTVESQPIIKDPLILKSLEYIHQYAFTNIRIQKIASLMGISHVHFTRRFKESIGISPLDYITLLRLRKAKTLLLETDDTIEHIATQCGYSNGFYFSRIFSKKLHISPSKFRKIHRI